MSNNKIKLDLKNIQKNSSSEINEIKENSYAKQEINETRIKLDAYYQETRNKEESLIPKHHTIDHINKINLETRKKFDNHNHNNKNIVSTKRKANNFSMSHFQSKLNSKYNKFIEINRSKFRIYSNKRDKIRSYYSDYRDNQEPELEGLLSSIKTNKLVINKNHFLSKNPSSSRFKKTNQNFFITGNCKNLDNKDSLIEKLIKEDERDAKVNNVKFFALSYGVRKYNDGFEAVDDKKNNAHPEDSAMRLRIINENLFKHRAAPLNPKNKSLYTNARTMYLKSNMTPVIKEDDHINLLVTSKGTLDIPSLSNKKKVLIDNENTHRSRLEMITNYNRKLRKSLSNIRENIEDKTLSPKLTESRNQIPINDFLFTELCETTNHNNERERIFKSANPHTFDKDHRSRMIIEDVKNYTDTNFFNKNNKKEVVYSTTEKYTYKKNKFKNFEDIKNTVFGIRKTSSNTRYSTTGKSQNHEVTPSKNLVFNSNLRPKSITVSTFEKKSEKPERRIVSGQDNKISNYLYRVLNKKDADMAIQKHKIF